MKVTTFQTVASKLANTIGREKGVRVTFGGTGAWSVPGHVHLPALPAGTTLTPFEADLMRGYLDHEVGHVRRSDFGILRRCQKEFKKAPSLKSLWNFCEDVWSENLTIEDYTDRFLNVTHTYMDERQVSEVAARQAAGNPVTMADLACRLTYREIWRKRGLERDVGSDVTLEDLGLGKVTELVEKEFPRCRTSQDNLKLARKIHALLKDAVENFEPPPAPGEEDGDEKSDGGSGGGEGDGGGDENEGVGGDAGADEGDGGNESGDGAGTGAGEYQNGRAKRDAKPTEAGSLDESAGRSEHQELLEEILQRIVGKNAKDENRGKSRAGGLVIPQLVMEEQPPDPNNPGEFITMYWSGDDYLPPAGTEHDRIYVYGSENLDTYRKERAAMAAQIASVKKALTVFLRSREMKAWTRGLEDGRLDEEMLADLCVTGNQRIFKQRRLRTFPNTAFAVVLDLSSSMAAHLVRLTATSFVEALVQLRRIKTMVAGFTTNSWSYPSSPGCGRTIGMDMVLFKAFDEPLRSAMGRLGAIGTTGYTPLGEGYAYGFEALVKRPELRRVLLLVTDGQPCYTWGERDSHLGCEHNDFALMRHVHEKCQTHRIETLGLAIGRDATIDGLVDRPERIKGIHELAGKVLEMTKRVVVPF